MTSSSRPQGMTAFIIIWLGQIISILASGMTQFAFSIWMYQETQSALQMGMLQVAFITPFLLMSPVAGVFVDRYNRKLMMMISDLFAGLATVGIFILYTSGHLEFWHLYIAAIFNGIGNTFQWPAYSAAITTMIPKEQLGRANGLMSLQESGPGIFSPILAGALLPFIGLSGIMLFDVVTFVTAILALVVVHIPQPQRSEEGKQAEGSFAQEAAFGFKYIFARPTLLGLQTIYFFGNLFVGIMFTIVAPMLLSRTNQDSIIYGSVQSSFAVGGLVGGIIMSAWGGLKRRSFGVLIGWILFGLGMSLIGLGQSAAWWIGAGFFTLLAGPFMDGSNQAFWQSKVAPDLQGRVFSARRLIAWFAQPIAPLIGGALADFVFEPAMKAGQLNLFTPLVGTGSGAGMSLLIFFCGICAMLVGASGFLFPALRNAEELLPDHDTVAT